MWRGFCLLLDPRTFSTQRGLLWGPYIDFPATMGGPYIFPLLWAAPTFSRYYGRHVHSPAARMRSAKTESPLGIAFIILPHAPFIRCLYTARISESLLALNVRRCCLSPKVTPSRGCYGSPHDLVIGCGPRFPAGTNPSLELPARSLLRLSKYRVFP